MTPNLDPKPLDMLARTRARTTRALLPWLLATVPLTLLAAADTLAQTTATAATTGVAPAASGAEQRLGEALAEYERNHWPEAYALAAVLADEGHAEAARLAFQMWRHGRALYGTEFVASARQVERWSRLLACLGGDASDAACRLVTRAR